MKDISGMVTSLNGSLGWNKARYLFRKIIIGTIFCTYREPQRDSYSFSKQGYSGFSLSAIAALFFAVQHRLHTDSSLDIWTLFHQ